MVYIVEQIFVCTVENVDISICTFHYIFAVFVSFQAVLSRVTEDEASLTSAKYFSHCLRNRR